MITTRQLSSPVRTNRRIDDVRIKGVHEIPLPDDLLLELPASSAVADLVCDARASVSRILRGEDRRLLVVIGPCSIHDASAALEYACTIRTFAGPHRQSLLIVMRVYFEKPRTRYGWKGLINDPHLDGTHCINEGLRAARRLLLDINGMGVPTATEFVDPITPQYIGDLISWAAIGARTTESQVHRELASGLSCPVGFKNSTSGDVRVAVNAVIAASRPHQFLGVTKSGKAAIVSTTGNTDCHIILRGGTEPNYDEASVTAAAALLAAEGLPPRVMVDCSHGNCAGDYRGQLVVAADVARQRRAGAHHICGVMAESNLIAGNQPFVVGGPMVPGLSITDPCLGLDETASLLGGLASLAPHPGLN
ncbi:MAG: 3-deoxy-7-phosphoheptulonate synthase [Vicinamibacteraceae bacterium]